MKRLDWKYERSYGGKVTSGSHEFCSADGHCTPHTKSDLAGEIVRLIEEESVEDIRKHPTGAIFILSADSPEYRMLIKRADKLMQKKRRENGVYRD